MKPVILCTTGIAALTLGSCQMSDEKAQSHVNFIVIYLDDMGYGDLSLTGASGYSTPNIDRMAMDGMLFTHFYSPQAVSSASRAGLLTGCYPNRIGISGAYDHNSRLGINPEEETIAEILKEKGYSTAIFGKWHLGLQDMFLPLQNGFDEFYGVPYSHDMWPFHPTGGDYYPPLPLFEGNEVLTREPDISLFTSHFTERAVGFIERNKARPFFIYLAHPMPHVPLAASDKFLGSSEQGLYGDVMQEIDWSVGEVLGSLEKYGLSENTLVIFTSDNGPWLNYGNHAGSSGGFREGKGTTFEGGQRVPCIMSWKGTIAPGTVWNKLAGAIDILPTIAAAAGTSLPERKIDGVNLLPVLKGEATVSPRDNFLFYYRANNLEAVTDGDWKLVFPHPGRTYEGFAPGKDGQPGKVVENHPFEGGLYDLRRDPGERYNVAESFPEVVARLSKIADSARFELGDNLTGVVGQGRRPPGRAASSETNTISP